MKYKTKHRLTPKRLLFIAAYGLCCILFILLAVELIYRFQLIDTYLPELRSYNPKEDLADNGGRKTILIMGDSMTAGNKSYPGIMRDKVPGYRVINSGVSGTCILETALTGPKRFAEFKPSVFVYQVYVGNDLFEIRHPVNWKAIPFLRNVYWVLSNHLRSLVYLNYRLMQRFVGLHQALSGTKDRRPNKEQGIDINIAETETFSAETYTSRTRINLRAEPYLLENQIMAEGDQRKEFEIFLNKLKVVLSLCREGECQAYVLVIPQCCQISDHYLSIMKLIGARFDHPTEIHQDEYPFVAETKKALAYKSNVSLLNPIQSLRKGETEGKSMYFQNDEHLTEDGQTAIAEFIVSYLKLE